MLHALPFNTFGEVAALGLEVQVYCPSCYTTRQKSIPRPNGSPSCAVRCCRPCRRRQRETRDESPQTAACCRP